MYNLSEVLETSGGEHISTLLPQVDSASPPNSAADALKPPPRYEASSVLVWQISYSHSFSLSGTKVSSQTVRCRPIGVNRYVGIWHLPTVLGCKTVNRLTTIPPYNGRVYPSTSCFNRPSKVSILGQTEVNFLRSHTYHHLLCDSEKTIGCCYPQFSVLFL